MKYGPFLFLGILCAMAASSLTFVLAPQMQSGRMEQGSTIPDTLVYPNQPVGVAHQGAEVYRANNCAACHTQQVRPGNLSHDLKRGLGVRYSVARDYLFDKPVQLGLQRIGPDLSNAGLHMDPNTILLHLYNPRITVPTSIMPPYPFLFEKQKIGRIPSPDALVLSAPFAPPAGYEIVPTKAGLSLAAYLTSLRQNSYLFETPPPMQPLKAKSAAAATTDTNAPAANTNSPAK